MQASWKSHFEPTFVDGTHSAMSLAAKHCMPLSITNSTRIDLFYTLVRYMRDLGLCGHTGSPSAATMVAGWQPKKPNGYCDLTGYEKVAKLVFSGWSCTTLDMAEYISIARR